MKKSTKTIGALTATAIALAVAVWVDTSPYRAARSELASTTSINLLESANNDLEQDLDRSSACPVKTRSCLIEAMPHTKSVMGTYLIAIKASIWLRNNPDDQELQTAVLAVIANARSEMLGSNKPLYDRYWNLTEAYDRSIFLSLFDRRKFTKNQFEKDADFLDKAENAVMLPDLVMRQSEWRRKAFASAGN